jgi:Protein of unknown function (DUF3800)
MRVTPDPSLVADIYIDETSQNNHRYLVIGCVATMMTDAAGLGAAIMQARRPELPQDEAKWTKVSKKKLPAYRRIIDVLFTGEVGVHFHSLVVDTTKLDHKRFNAGSREIGFNKEVYQLAMKCARLYSTTLFHLYPDYRETTQKPEDLRLMLNRGCGKSGDKREWPFRRCQFRDSKTTLPLQLVDIIIGGLAYRLNGHDKKESASPAKSELSAYILERAKIVDPFEDTARSADFTIWHRKLR